MFRLSGLNSYNLDISNTNQSGQRFDFHIGSSAGTYTFNNSAGELVRIDSAGRMMIGTTTAGSGDADNLTVATSGHGGITIRSGSSHAAAMYFADGTSGSQNYQGIVQYVHSTDQLQFYANYAGDSNPRMVVDSSGRVGVGTASPNVYGVHASNSSNSVYFKADSSAVSTVYGSASSLGVGLFGTFSNNALAAYTNSAERLRIGASGDVAVGTTTLPNYSGYTTIRVNNNTNGGVFEVSNNNVIKGQLYYDGTRTRVRANVNTDLVLDTHNTERVRITSLGNVGIGVSPSYSGPFGGAQRVLHIGGTAAPGLRLQSSTSNQGDYIIQASNSGGRTVFSNLSSNADTTFRHSPGGSGTETIRFQNSGGISFNGDTAQVNALDDYEEGTWTPTVLYYDGTLTIESADYVKVGQLVHVNMYVSFSNTSDGSDILFDGLPYTVAGDGNNHYSLLTAHSNGNMPNFHLRAQGTTTQMRGVYLANSNGDNKPSYNNVANKFIIMGGTYRCTP